MALQTIASSHQMALCSINSLGVPSDSSTQQQLPTAAQPPLSSRYVPRQQQHTAYTCTPGGAGFGNQYQAKLSPEAGFLQSNHILQKQRTPAAY
ncbi:hypothetical protein Nepgr_008052 [Nepenthes gracilis]|uniref:Uncharacterized protein n=1 Tax=Nepenthes gracilis TaxID=150966 RepID=A0AAD3S8V0_NEPGR|nr:hypothetical protein Nepgr_008052 [Nepenthes gracilis]